MILTIGGVATEIPVDDSSYRYRAIMGENSLTLTFALATYLDIPVGSSCTFQGETYTLTRPQNFKKNNSRDFSYTLILDSAQSQLDKYKFRDTNTNRLKFSLTARPEEHLTMLVANLNLRDSGWSVGSYVDAVEKPISYNHTFCKDALKAMATAFDTEWEIVGKAISLRKVEYNKSTPLALSYGKGNGFKPGLGRANMDNTKPIEVLYVQGGNRNIDPSKYGATELLLPKSQSYTYNGRAYVTDADGLSIHRSDRALSTMDEDSLDLSNIYPSRVGTISNVITVDAVKNFYDFVDSSIPLDLDFSACLTAGETMTVIFQSGMLAGRELEVSYDHVNRKFAIVPQEIDGVTMPGTSFLPATGDTYAVFGIQLPDAYICNNSTQTGGSWDMYKQAVKYLYENEDPRFSFTGELDGIWAKTNWGTIGGQILLGGYISFTDAQFQTSAILIRIVGIKDYINNPYKPQIELSNITIGGTVSDTLAKLETTEVVIDQTFKESIQFTKRRFRDAKETLKLLSDSLLGFSGGIDPVTVQTMQLLIGDESLQYRFVNSKTTPTQIDHSISYDNATKVLSSAAGILQHMSLGISTISSSHAPAEYKFWDMASFTSAPMADTVAYYLYAKVSTTGTTGVFLLSATAIAMTSVSGYYHLLVGILNSEYDSSRSFVPLYGFTEILPGRITTNKIVSADGYNFLDFLNNAFHVGNSTTFLDWNSAQDGKLRLKGTLIQSPAGVESPLGVFRGAYSGSNTYYPGDEVTYLGSSYRFIYASPASGIVPTNATYWIIVASAGATGQPGVDGTDYEYIFARTTTNVTPATPATSQVNDFVPTGWTDDPAGVTNTYIYEWVSTRFKVAGTWSAFSAPALWSKYSFDGSNGVDGTDYEYIFKLTSTSATPTTPATSQTNDFIPTGWTDDPTGVSSTKPYEWVATRSKTAGVWSVFSAPALWAKYGFDGSQGIQGSPGTNGSSLYTWLKYADTPTTGMNDSPTGKTYMGIAYNKTSSIESTTYADYDWSLITGTQGIQGPAGSSLYTWVKYGTSVVGAGLNDSPTGMTYIGLAFNKTTATESTVASDYTWSLIQGPQGSQGIPGSAGTNGTNGASLYTWLKYADTPTTGMNDSPTGKTYMGIAYNKTSSIESTVYADYDWSLITGTQGIQGVAGSSLYTWVKYGTSAVGAGLNDSPTGMTYIGLAYNKTTATESTVASDYTWSLIQGPQGSQGIPGSAGTNGASLYTWLKYADGAPTGMADSPGTLSLVGIALNQSSSVKSAAYADYAWSQVNSATGVTGLAGLYTWVKYGTSNLGAGMSDSPTGCTYIGLAFGKATATKSTTASDYLWLLMSNTAASLGSQGVAGSSLYTWVKYGTSSVGAGLSDSITGATYIGIAYNKTTATKSITASDYTWTLLSTTGGASGLAGLYTWIKFGTSAAGAGLSDTTTSKTYLGLAFGKSTATESSLAADYTWIPISSTTGMTGSQEVAGTTLYTWVKFSESYPLGMSDLPDGKKYMGISYNQVTSIESSSYADYAWSLITGADGIDGVAGSSLYTWVKYGTSAVGAGMSDSPTGCSYIGFAFNKTTATESTVATDYTWSLITGAAGADGAYFEYQYAKNGSTTAPPTIVLTDVNPVGWATTMPTLTSLEYLWMTVSKKTAVGALVQNWSTPVRVSGVTGATGATGAAGMYFEYRYAKNTSTTTAPTLATSTLSPAGWTNTIPTLVAGEYLWCTVCAKTGDGLGFTQYWQTPIRLSGADGAQGPQGIPGSAGTNGTNGATLYTWLKYADTPTTGMSDSPAGKTYMGIAYNKTVSTESTTYADYDWSLITGTQGIQGPAGSTLYTWVKYATSASGSGINDSPSGMTHIGFAFNKTTATESTVTTDYTWSLIQGPQGITGPSGAIGNTGANGPAMAFQGDWNATKSYYGNNLRVDAVKYLGVYYLARADAGLFNTTIPTDTSKWNTIGSQFDQVATNLLLAEQANIAGWIFSKADIDPVTGKQLTGQITSQNVLADLTTPRAVLDGVNGALQLKSDITTYTPSGGSQAVVQTIDIKSADGYIKSSNTSNENAWISSQGIFANKAGTQAVAASSGVEIKAAVVGLGNGNLNKNAYSSGMDSICGVFGSANNIASTPAPSWGGMFYKLLANGLYLRVIQTAVGMTLNDIDTFISSYNTSTIIFYLPPFPQLGQTILIRKNNSAVVTVWGNGHSIMATTMVSNVNVGIGAGDLGFFVYDGQYWSYNYMSK